MAHKWRQVCPESNLCTCSRCGLRRNHERVKGRYRGPREMVWRAVYMVDGAWRPVHTLPGKRVPPCGGAR